MKNATTIVAALATLTIFPCKKSEGQEQRTTHDSDRISFFFNEIKEATKKGATLWNKDLHGALLLIDPETQQIFANEPDTAGFLKPYRGFYSGPLPDDFNYANTTVEWHGKQWATAILPLPEDVHERIDLLAHELFHAAQPALGFILYEADNNHLDLKDGRIYLRMEFEALRKALQSPSKAEKSSHLANALTFRKYRNALYPGSVEPENNLELKEGLAEFTGLIISGRSEEQTKKHLENRITTFFDDPTFVRSFGYHTISAYGYLLYTQHKNWNKDITATTHLADYFIHAFNVNIPADLGKTVFAISDNYNGQTIVKEEVEREENNQKRIAEYKQKFIKSPHFDLRLEQMTISFDPGNIMPLEDMGTVYLHLRVTDKWGILTVENGALMNPQWNKITITCPEKVEDKKIFGDGWTLELTDLYTIEKDETSGNYGLSKKY